MKFVFRLRRPPLPVSDSSGTTALLLTLISKRNVAYIKTNVPETRED